MRTAPLALALVLAPALAWAQNAPTSQPAQPKVKPTRIELQTTCTLDGTKTAPNQVAKSLFRWLAYARFRVDVKTLDDARWDKRVKRVNAAWEKDFPSAENPVEYVLVVSQSAKYSAAKFYGELTSHNFKGKLKCALKTKNGQVLVEFEYPYSWGTLPRKGRRGPTVSKSQAFARFCQMMHVPVIVTLLQHPALRSKIPTEMPVKSKKTKKLKLENRRKLIDKVCVREKETLLKYLDRQNDALKKGKLATYLRGLKVVGEKKAAPKKK